MEETDAILESIVQEESPETTEEHESEPLSAPTKGKRPASEARIALLKRAREAKEAKRQARLEIEKTVKEQSVQKVEEIAQKFRRARHPELEPVGLDARQFLQLLKEYESIKGMGASPATARVPQAPMPNLVEQAASQILHTEQQRSVPRPQRSPTDAIIDVLYKQYTA